VRRRVSKKLQTLANRRTIRRGKANLPRGKRDRKEEKHWQRKT